MRKTTIAVFISLLFLLVALSTAHAGITKGPILMDPTKRGVTVSWETLDLNGEILYGATSANLDQTVEVSGNDGGMLRGKIECLKPDTKYYYQIQSGASTSEVFYFFTGVEPDAPFMFVAYGDTRTNKEDHQLVTDAIIDEHPEFLLHGGDFVDVAVFVWEWNDFFDVFTDLAPYVPLVPVMGNHEFWGGQPFYRKYFATPDHNNDNSSIYSFQYGNTFFINIDVAQLYLVGTAQYNWVVEQFELAASIPSIKHCVVQAHFPPYSASNHGTDTDVLAFRNSFVPLFEEYGVDVIFGGHDHNFQHSEVNGIHYIVTGGGGAPRYSVDPESWTVAWEKALNYIRIDVADDTMTLTAKRADGTVIEQFDVVNDFGGVGGGDELPVPCADGDYDQDGLTDGVEYGMCTDTYIADTDGDTYNDGDEVEAGSDPCDENSTPAGDDDTTDDDTTDDDITDDDITDDDTTDDDTVDDGDDDDDIADDDAPPSSDDDDDDDGCGC